MPAAPVKECPRCAPPMSRLLVLVVCCLVLSCAPRTADVPAVMGRPGDPSGASVYDDPVWKGLIDAARSEGRVVVAVNPNPDITERLPAVFRERFGVDVELVSGRSGDLMSRLEAERTAGLSTIDVVIAGGD